MMPYRSIDDPAKLRRVLESTLLIEAQLQLPALLGHFLEEACSMTGARYGAIGILNDERTALAEFLTVGLEHDEEERIGARPTGRGVLGLLISDPRPVRLADLGSHPDSYGFPPNHPPMTSFLGLPIKVRDEVYGNIYLTNKIGWSEFTLDDEALVGALAVAAGIAIENARLHRRVQEVAVYDDRDRLARDLHDTVIQRLFALGLHLQGLAKRTGESGTADQLNMAVDDVDITIRHVRSAIFELGSSGIDRGVRASVLSLLRELDPVVGFEVRVLFNGPVDSAVPDEIVEHLLATVREAVTNVGRHAQATEATVVLTAEGGRCRLQVSDNGRGMVDSETTDGGLGLVNLRRRAEKLHGEFTFESPETGGTVLTWDVPVTRRSS